MNQHMNQEHYGATTKLNAISDAVLATEVEHNLSDQERLAINALPKGSALLIVRKGPNLGARFLLDTPSAIAGRHPDNDIFLDDVTVSRKHAAFNRVDNKFFIRDLGSLNGTYLGTEVVDEARLANGDEVQIGKYRFMFFTKD